MRHNCQTLFFFLSFLLFTACKTIEAPKPIANEKVVEYLPSLSFVQLPVSIPLSSINQLVNQKMGGVVYDDRSYTQPTTDDYQLIVMRKSPELRAPAGRYLDGLLRSFEDLGGWITLEGDSEFRTTIREFICQS